MTENMTTWRDDEETILDSDIWTIAKCFGEYTPEEEHQAWREAVRVLEGFCQVADGLNHEPLILALVDAKCRAEGELERARERTRREAGELTEYEQDTLTRLLDRADAFSNAWALYSQERPHQEKTVEILNEMRLDADEQFNRYKREIGLEA